MPRWPRQVLFGDIDAMFASAAVVKDPSLAGQPIAVGGPPPRGIIAAASYAVRAFGVRSAMPTAEALRLCPHLRLIPPDRPLYRRLHEDLRAVTDRLFPATEWSSIDEFYVDTTDLQTRYPDPAVLAQSREAIDRGCNRPHVHGRSGHRQDGCEDRRRCVEARRPCRRGAPAGSGVSLSPTAAGAAGHRTENRGEARAVWHHNDRRPLGSAMGPDARAALRRSSPLDSSARAGTGP